MHFFCRYTQMRPSILLYPSLFSLYPVWVLHTFIPHHFQVSFLLHYDMPFPLGLLWVPSCVPSVLAESARNI